MKIAVYCQHVLGMGHLFRTLEILNALAGHERLLILGGPDTPATLPDGVQEVVCQGGVLSVGRLDLELPQP